MEVSITGMLIQIINMYISVQYTLKNNFEKVFNQQYFANRQIIYLYLEKVCSLVLRMLSVDFK